MAALGSGVDSVALAPAIDSVAPAAASMALVADELRKTYAGTEVVAGLSFVVQPGTCFGLLGPNGAGPDPWRHQRTQPQSAPERRLR